MLRLFLLHVARGYSLCETSVRAKEADLAAISNVDLMKRLRRAEESLRWLCTELVAENGVSMPRHDGTGAVRFQRLPEVTRLHFLKLTQPVCS